MEVIDRKMAYYPGAEKLTPIAQEIVSLLRDMELTYAECQITTEIVRYLLDCCLVGQNSALDYEN